MVTSKGTNSGNSWYIGGASNQFPIQGKPTLLFPPGELILKPPPSVLVRATPRIFALTADAGSKNVCREKETSEQRTSNRRTSPRPMMGRAERMRSIVILKWLRLRNSFEWSVNPQIDDSVGV